MINTSHSEDEAFFDVNSDLTPVNRLREKKTKVPDAVMKHREASDIPIDQPMLDGSVNDESLFDVACMSSTKLSEGKPDRNKDVSSRSIHRAMPFSAVFFTQPSDPASYKTNAHTTVAEVFPVANSTSNVVQLREQARSEADNHEWVLLDSNTKGQGEEHMHALKKEHNDRFQEEPSPVVNIIASAENDKIVLQNAPHSAAPHNDQVRPFYGMADTQLMPPYATQPESNKVLSPSPNGEEKQTMKSRIVPSIETSSFQASVVEGETSSDECIVVLIGRIDHEQVRELENFLNRVIQKSTTSLFCDIAGLTSINSSGWGLLVAEMQRLRKRGGNLFLCGLQGTVEHSFKVLELDKLFLTFRTVSEAMRCSSPDQMNIRPFPKTNFQEEPAVDNFGYLTLEEKIQHIVAEDPLLGANGIRKALRSDTYGNTKISGWKLMSLLRSMGLGTKEERYRFFRSS